ncbi:MAG TPA: penicillin-insensitive murein endopeptidase [Burkholderiaceae bacterium]|nr:penicillin-insensitive murein endopeptidase [Burkholderiaceae bacterium]
MAHAIFELLPFRFRAGMARSAAGAFPGASGGARAGVGARARSRSGLARELDFEAAPDRSSRDYAVWIQSSLNRILGLRLALDGIVGTLTRSAIRSFQVRSRLVADGIVGPMTEAALIRAGASHPPLEKGSSPPVSGQQDPRISVELPLEGAGYYSYDRELDADRSGRPHQFGRPETIAAVKAIGAAWQRRHPNGPRIGIGHLSLRGGGPTPGHSQHRTGFEVDVRPVRKDGREAPVTWRDSTYSQALTRELVDLMRANRILPVYRILFNDSAIAGTQWATGHDNHLHLWFSEP